MKKEIFFKTALIFSAIIFYFSITGLKNPVNIPGNIEENFFVLIVGIDKGIEDESNYRLTVLAENFSGETSSSESSTSKGKIPDILTVEAPTIFEAKKKFSEINTKQVLLGHVKYLLISEDIAKEKILDVMDYFTRDNEIRINTTMAIVKDMSTESFLKSWEKVEKFTPDLLDGEFRNINRSSLSEEKDILNFMVEFNNLYSGAYIPSIGLITEQKDEKIEVSQKENSTKEESDSKEESEKSYYMNLNGFAIFREAKLIGFLSDAEARGLNWVNSKIQTGVITVKDSSDKKISLEIISSSSKVKIKLDGDTPEAIIDIKFTSSIIEVMSRNNIFNEAEYEKLNEEQKNVVKKEAENVIKYAQENDVDILRMADKIYHQHPLKWEKIKDKWNDTFKTMKITVNVDSLINRTFHITEPIRSVGGENK
jgi:spore germination protein KC